MQAVQYTSQSACVVSIRSTTHSNFSSLHLFYCCNEILIQIYFFILIAVLFFLRGHKCPIWDS